MSKMTKTVAALGVVAGLGVAMLPMGAFAAPVHNGPSSTDEVYENVQFQAQVAENIEISATNLTVDGGDANSKKNATGSTTVKIVTNNADGYTASIAANTGEVKDSSGVVTTQGTADMVGTNTSNKIPGGVTVSQGTSAWGYKIGTISDITPASKTPAQFANTTAASANGGDEYTLEFAASVSASQAADTYTGQVVLTATAK